MKRYIWAIARLGGWKGYLSERKSCITTFGIELPQQARHIVQVIFAVQVAPVRMAIDHIENLE